MKLFVQLEVRYSVDHGQGASRRSFGIVFAGARIAEIDQDPVAHISRDKTLEPFLDFGDRTMKAAIRPRRSSGSRRMDNAVEPTRSPKHDRELAALDARRGETVFLDGFIEPLFADRHTAAIGPR